MNTQLTPEEIDLLLKDMAEICLRPPEGYGEEYGDVGDDMLPQLSWGKDKKADFGTRFGVLTRLCRRFDNSRLACIGMLAAGVFTPLAGITMFVALAGPELALTTLGCSALLGLLILLTRRRGAYTRFGLLFEAFLLGNEVPLVSVEHGLAILAGLLLLLPDPVSDALGIALLFPSCRKRVARLLHARLLSPRVQGNSSQ